MIVVNKPEPTWTYLKELEKVKEFVSKMDSKFNKNIENQGKLILNVASSIKSDVRNTISEFKINANNILNSNIVEAKGLYSTLLSEVKGIERDLQLKMDSLDKEHNDKNIQIYNTLNAYQKKVDTMHFDIIDNEDNLSFTYVNPNGALEYGSFKKLIPDNETLKLNDNNKVSLKYQFNSNTFNIQNDIINPIGLSLKNGSVLNADRINNDLNNVNYNIKSLTYKIEAALKKLNTINGYIASNNFKTSKLTSDVLTKFALECLSNSENKIAVDQIPSGTKIKNTFDNHIWVFNIISQNGLTTYKWEDFGSDSICIANNDGVHGLVTGSQDRFKAFIDVNGTISINNLEEEFQDLLQSLSELTTQIKDIQSEYTLKIDSIESRLKALEANA